MTRVVPGPALERLGAEHDLDVWPEDRPIPRDELLRRVHDAEGLLSMLSDRIDEELLEAAPRLRAVANYAVGYDNVDVPALTARGVPLGNTPDVLTDATADIAFALILAAARRLVEGAEAVRKGEWAEWSPTALLGHDIHGATLGIVGPGRIGRAVARRAQGFGMTVIESGRTSGVPLDELLERSDFVSIHTPLTADTRGLIGERELRLMKQTAVLVNTSRGPIVDTGALVRALEQGWIAAAGLDVTDPEPLPVDHPLAKLPNATVVPHIGSATHRTREAMADLCVDNLLAALRGRRMPHCVNPEVYR
ncbi:MAG: 2-hydroxyacid dehydrogenase [Thermoleophilaceae bacterium]